MQSLQHQQASQYSNQMFGSLLTSKSHQYVKINHVFNQNGQFLDQYEITMHVYDLMTIKQLTQDYVKANFLFQQPFIDKGKYILIYGKEFILQEDWTIQQVKKRICQDRLCGQQVRMYRDDDLHFLQLQGCLNYQNFQKKYAGNIAQFTIKFQPNEKYIYLNEPRGIMINQLVKNLYQLPKSAGVTIKKNQSFVLKYQVQKKKEQLFKQKKYKIHQEGNKKYIFLKQHQDQQVREFASYGEIIILESFKPDSIWFQDHKIKKDFMIQIQVYIGNVNPEELQHSKSKLSKDQDIVSIIIAYSKAKTMKVRTLLKENNIPNFQQISLIYQDFVIKPIQKFSKIEDFNIQIENKPIKFVGITQNFLFYKQIRTFAQSSNNKNMEQIYQQLMNRQKNPIKKTQREECDKKVSQRVKQIQEETYKQADFLNPIVLYTSPLIYQDLNEFARQTSASHFDIQTMLQKYWQYPFTQKLINSLQLIPNFKGLVYRGVKNVAFNYKEGDIIQFNTFISTSRNIGVAMNFANHGGVKVVLKIQTFSGKEIYRFSYFKSESQVLLFPYTKFKVLRSQKVQNIHQIDLLQIPVPKKIPGDIVVWIDANITQNSKTFNKITQKNQINNLEIIQLKSNEHLQDWIKQFKPILNLHNVNIHFITNLNRPPNFSAEGIQTLRIIRRLRSEAEVVFYIGDIRKTLQKLAGSGFAKQKNVRVVNFPAHLEDIICTWKRQIN